MKTGTWLLLLGAECRRRWAIACLVHRVVDDEDDINIITRGNETQDGTLHKCFKQASSTNVFRKQRWGRIALIFNARRFARSLFAPYSRTFMCSATLVT